MTNITEMMLSNAHTIEGKKFVSLPVSELVIDKAYQRPIRSKIKVMIARWDYELCDAVLVSYRDGKFYVVDGQHRVEAARRVGVKMLACQLLEGLTQTDEAKRFVAQNTSSSTLSPYDLFNAHLVLGDPIDTAVKAICDKWQIKIGTKIFKTPSRLGGLKEAQDTIRICGKSALDWTFSILHEAQWHLVIGGHSAAIIKALREVWKEGRNYNAAITVLKGHTPRSLNAAAQAKYPYYSREAAVSKFVMDSVRAVAKKNTAAAA